MWIGYDDTSLIFEVEFTETQKQNTLLRFFCDVFLHFERGAHSGAYRAGAGCAAAQALQEGPDLSWPVIRSIDEASCRSASPLIVNSEMVRAEMFEHYGIDPARIRLVRNGVDTARFTPGPKAEHPTVVFVGANPSRKGLKTALSALRLLPGVRLDVVGSVGRRGPRWAAQVGVPDRVRFHGNLACPATVMSRAHAMILPTRYDASANVCLEAMGHPRSLSTKGSRETVAIGYVRTGGL